MKPVAFMRELVAKGMSWEDAAEIAEKFEQTIEQRVAEAVEAAMPKRSASAERQAAYRERKRVTEHNANHNADHNAVTDAVIDSVDNASDEALSPALSPQTPLTHPHTRESVTTRTRKGGDDFERFWAAYPLKKAKDVARKAFPRALGKASVETMIAAVERQRTWDQWQRGFIPHASTWLNNGRWADEEPEIPQIPMRAANDRPDRHPLQPAASRAARRGVWAEVLAEERGSATGFGD